MFRTALVSLISVLVLVQFPSAQDKKIALVIGNSSYKRIQALSNSGNDATDMTAVLKRIGYSVVSGTNLDRKAMRGLIDDFNIKIRGADVALFYYSGHGVQVEGENYLVPVSAEVGVAGDVPEECVSLTRVIARMNEAGAKTNVIILDACRDNPFKAVSRGIERGLAVVGQKPPESIIVYATAENEKAADGSGRNGAFTKALLKNIERQESFTDILLDVSAQVRTETGDMQKPAVYQNLTRRVFLAGEKTAPAPIAQAPSPAPAAVAVAPAPAAAQAAGVGAAKNAPSFGLERATGSLVVTTVIAGSLYLDGKLMGELPAGMKAKLDSVEVGERSVEMRFPDGQSETKKASVADGKPTNVAFISSLVAWYKLDETNGTVAADSSGNGRDGILKGGATWVPGKLGNAVSMNGMGQYVQLPAGLTKDLQALTLACWVNLSETAPNACIFSFGAGKASYFSLAPRYWDTSVNFIMNNGGIWDKIAYPMNFPVKTWIHLAVTLSDKRATLYVDGKKVQVRDSFSLTPSRMTTDTTNYLGKTQFSDNDGNNSVSYLCGTIDDFRIYSRALSAQEIAALYAGMSPTASITEQTPPAQQAAQKPKGQGESYAIGETGPAGGIVFYDKGSESDGWRYLEVALGDLGLFQRDSNDKKSSAEKFSGGDAHDWRLPSIDELILMRTNLYKKGLGGFKARRYWSFSNASSQSSEEFLDFYSGTVGWAGHSDDMYPSAFIRPVRQF